MATSILYRATPVSMGAIELDASLSETHSSEVEVTEHPVETGSNVAEHIRPKAQTLRVEGIITDGPLASMPIVDGKPTPIAGRAKDALARLRQMKDSGEVVTVVTGLDTYRDLVITGVEVPRDTKSLDAVRLTVSFKQVRQVQTQSVTLKRAPRPAIPEGADKKPKGTQTPVPAPRNVSLWRKLSTEEGRASVFGGLPMKWSGN